MSRNASTHLLAPLALLLAACAENGSENPTAPKTPERPEGGSLFDAAGPSWKVRREADEILSAKVRAQLEEGPIWVRDEPLLPKSWNILERVPQRPGVRFWHAFTRFQIRTVDLSPDCPEGSMAHEARDLRLVPSIVSFVDPAREVAAGDYTVAREGVGLILKDSLEAPEEGYRVTYPTEKFSVLRNFPLILDAKTASTTHDVALENVTRPARLLYPPAAIEAQVRIPRGARLHFAFGLQGVGFDSLDDRLEITTGRSDGVRFRVHAERESGEIVEVFDRSLTPAEADRFHEARLDLKELAGETVTLVLSTEAGGDARDDFAFYTAPYLEAEKSEPSLPNVLLIVLDTTRPDALSCYGNERKITPRLDAFAREGTRFAHARSASSWTLPTHSSLFSGLFPTQHGTVGENQRLPNELLTIAELFREHGWRTAAFTDGGVLLPAYGLAQGFDLWDARAGGVRPIVDRAKKFLAEDARPFFLFVHTYEVHGIYDPPEPFRSRFVRPYDGPLSRRVDDRDLVLHFTRGDRRPTPEDVRYVRDLYEAGLAYTDHVIGELLDELDTLGLRDDTVVLITSDHGEEFYDHESWSHHLTLYEEVLRVPMIARYPKHFAPGRVVDTPVRLIDVAPTFAQIADLPRPKDWAGASLLNLEEERAYLAVLKVLETQEQQRALLDPQGRKWIVTPENFSIPGPARQELYDLGADPLERENNWRPASEVEFERIWRHLGNVFPDRRSGAEPGEVQLSAEEIRALQALGYTVGGPPPEDDEEEGREGG